VRLAHPTSAVFLVLLFFGLWLVPSAASAHAVLEHTAPSAGNVPSAPDAVTLTFDEPPRTRFSVVHVLAPDGHRVDGGQLTLDGSTVRQPLAGPRPAGTYTVDWRVVSDDGHPVSGSWQFTAAAAVADAIPAAGPAASPAAASKGGGHSGHVVFALVVAAALVASLVGERWWRHRKRATR
jgi:methionine-rich copper-binding protein CopC